MTPDFWRGRRVMVTGHTGFKGVWLCQWLNRLGAEVTGFALPPQDHPNLYDTVAGGQRTRSVLGDIRESALVEQVVFERAPEIIFHLAAQSLVRYSYNHPIETFHVNVMGTVHLLEAVRRNGAACAVVVVTSDKCYENREWIWSYRENEPMGGSDPYSSSKGCAELVTSAYRRSFFSSVEDDASRIAIASARAGNVIGGGDWAADRLVPDVLRAFSAGELAMIRSPGAIRPWQHVLEPLSGYLLLAERLVENGIKYAEGWNFGPVEGDTRPVARVVDKLSSLWGDGAGWTTDDGAHPHEAHLLKLDSSKALQLLGWQPRWSLDTALERVVDWHRAYLRGDDMRQQVIGDIDDYMAVPPDNVASDLNRKS